MTRHDISGMHHREIFSTQGHLPYGRSHAFLDTHPAENRSNAILVMQGVARSSGQDELQPEGNGTGFLWDNSGNVVTNYHVLQGALASMGRRPGGQKTAQNNPVVAKITLLGMHHCLQCLPKSC